MIKVENTEVYGWEAAIRGMRNPMNSWEKSDRLLLQGTHNNQMQQFGLLSLWLGMERFGKKSVLYWG